MGFTLKSWLIKIFRLREFKKLHPSFRGNEYDLWEKFDAHLNQSEEAQRQASLKNQLVSDTKDEPDEKVHLAIANSQTISINPMILSYIKSLIESNKIYIPTRSVNVGVELQSKTVVQSTIVPENTPVTPVNLEKKVEPPKSALTNVSNLTKKPTIIKLVPAAPKIQLNQVCIISITWRRGKV